MQVKFSQGHSVNCLSWRGGAFNKIAVGDCPHSAPNRESNKKGSQQLPFQGQFCKLLTKVKKISTEYLTVLWCVEVVVSLTVYSFWHLLFLSVFLMIKVCMFSLKSSAQVAIKLLQSC